MFPVEQDVGRDIEQRGIKFNRWKVSQNEMLSSWRENKRGAGQTCSDCQPQIKIIFTLIFHLKTWNEMWFLQIRSEPRLEVVFETWSLSGLCRCVSVQTLWTLKSDFSVTQNVTGNDNVKSRLTGGHQSGWSEPMRVLAEHFREQESVDRRWN